MGILDFLKPKRDTANTAKDRLQIIIAEQRRGAGGPAYIESMRREILEVVRKYVHVPDDAIRVSKDRQGDYDVLDISIELPEDAREP